jgi:ADP-heptose:LPS heptosyltransferase
MGRLNIISRNIRTGLAKFVLDKRNKISDYQDFYDDKTGTLDISKFKTVLFIIHDDRIGDMVISTISFREIKKKYPNIKISVLCGKNSKEILKYNSYVDEIIEISGKFLKDFHIYKRLRFEKDIVLVDFFEFDLRPAHLLFLRIVNPKFLIGFYKKKYKTYDISIEETFFDVHIINRHKVILKIFGIDNADFTYDIFISEKEKECAKFYLDKSGGKYKVVVNPFASSKHRTFKREKLQSLIEQIEKIKDCCIYILCPPNRYESIKDIESDKKAVFIVQLKSILSVAYLIKECDIVISPDTSIIHIASAFKKKTIGLYLDFSNRLEKTDIIWGPNNPNAVIINADSQNGKAENDIKNIDNEKILKVFKEMI